MSTPNPKVIVRYFNVLMVTVIIGLLAFTFYKSQDHQCELLEAQQRSTEEVNRHLDCIIVYFSLPARTELTITDINKCTIDRNGTPEQFFQTNKETGELEVNSPTLSSLKAPQSPKSQVETTPSRIEPQRNVPDPVQPEPQPEEQGLITGTLKDTETYLDKITKGLINGR